MPQILPTPPFAAPALEPYIDERTMKLHQQVHRVHVDSLNAVLSGYPEWHDKSAGELLVELGEMPRQIRRAVRYHAGGQHNHTLFWSWLASPGNGGPEGELAHDLETTFGSAADFRERFTAAACDLMGSGWTWLALSGERLEIVTTANEDSLLLHGKVPVLGVDVWEHAYFLSYGNRRRDYLDAWWNVVNWDAVTRHYVAGQAAAGHLLGT